MKKGKKETRGHCDEKFISDHVKKFIFLSSYYANIMVSIYAKNILHRLVQVLFRLD